MNKVYGGRLYVEDVHYAAPFPQWRCTTLLRRIKKKNNNNLFLFRCFFDWTSLDKRLFVPIFIEVLLCEAHGLQADDGLNKLWAPDAEKEHTVVDNTVGPMLPSPK